MENPLNLNKSTHFQVDDLEFHRLPNTTSNLSQGLSGSSSPDRWNHKSVEIDIPINPQASSHLFSHFIFLSSSVGFVYFPKVILKSPLLRRTSSMQDFHEK